MSSKGNPFMNNPVPLEEKRWSNLPEPIPNSSGEPTLNKYDAPVCDRFKTERTDDITDRTNSFTKGENHERTYSSFISFTDKPKKPEIIFDMETMTEGTLNDEFPSLL